MSALSFDSPALETLFDASLIDLLSVIWLDIVLSGDNALVIGMAAASLAPHLRRRAILFGMVLAIVIRILAALAATYIYEIPWIRFVGGLALIWVAYKLYQGVRQSASVHHANVASGEGGQTDRRSVLQALVTICIADVSMSVDNVLAVAGIAHDNRPLLVLGLALSIVLMAFFATIISRLIARHAWISFAGIAILIYVALDMMLSSVDEVMGILSG